MNNKAILLEQKQSLYKKTCHGGISENSDWSIESEFVDATHLEHKDFPLSNVRITKVIQKDMELFSSYWENMVDQKLKGNYMDTCEIF